MFSGRTAYDRGDNELSSLLARMRATGVPVIDLAEANPTRAGIRDPALLDALADPASLAYEPDPKGLLATREAISSRTGSDPARIFLSASTSEAYGWLFKLLCDPGEAVLVPKPGYPLFDFLAGLESVRAEPYRLEYASRSGWRIDLEDLERAARSPGVRAIVAINPNNPTGSYIRDDEREAMAILCERKGIALISDEVFLPYALDMPRDEAAKRSLSGEGRCLSFTLDGLSKRLCLPQVKLGWLSAGGPEEAVAEACSRLEVIADTYLSASAPAMHAARRLLPLEGALVAKVRERLLSNLARLRSEFGSGDSHTRVLACEGGWTALLELPRVIPDEELACRLLGERGVFLHPGYFYDFGREGILALSLLPEPSVFSEGVSRLGSFLRSAF